MTNDWAAQLGGRRLSGAISAAVAVILAIVSLAELSRLDALDVVLVAAPAATHLVFATVERLPAWTPLGVAWVVTILLNLPPMRTEAAIFFVVLALADLAIHEPRRLVVLVSGLATVAAPALVALFVNDDWGWQYWMLGLGFGWGFGEFGYRLRLAHDELASTRALIVDQAALDMRHRIARDVHDVLGHSLTIVMLQITAARHLLRRDPGEADAALDDAQRVGRDSLNQLRWIVGMLRDGEPDPTDDRTGPSPTLEDLERVLDDYRTAGFPVHAEVHGPIADLDMARSMAGYRIVQEALANVAKHAPGAATGVTIRVDDDGKACRIVVDNRGGGRRASRSPGGFGLAGMRERARSVGGVLDAGPVTNGWRVTAELPALREQSGPGT